MVVDSLWCVVQYRDCEVRAILGEYHERLFWGALLVLLSSAVLADTSVADFTTMSIPASDLSMRYLGEVFGAVSNVLPGHGGQLMGRLFYMLNCGILIVASLWLSYTARD